ncbi:HNH endonuclease domain-containing protein [Cellulomonas sp. RIT-PI-Y]|uniref:HNH endonuclease n=1 Tax=Cellulomonas sp. RIT-PI-Y TaxID=3035297 RepID=UPI0021D8397A|nr:HNH endonuclease domain-containing protein [Cellulomonas sp. RIT-PI-Y]
MMWRADLPLESLPERLGWPVVAGLIVIALVASVVRKVRMLARRDPVRWFDTSQRAAGRSLAGGRCEYSARVTPWRRCRARADQADHFYPWSRGGATSMSNQVAACRWHNQTKGARWPSPLLAWVIARRRRGYFPAGRARRPGQRYRRRQRR